MVTQVPDEGLTSVEQALVDHVGCGEWLDLAAVDEVVDEASMRSWGESRTCRSSVIRDILRGRLVADPDPHGLQLRGARISGRLDLGNVATDVWLELSDCLLEEGIEARDARLPGLVLSGCQVEHPAEPPLAADRLICGELVLVRARVIGHSEPGAVRLAGARIGGNLECGGAELRNDAGPALSADGLQVGQDMFLTEGFTACGSGGEAAVRVAGARIGGQLALTGAELRSDSGPALNGQGLQVGQDMHLTDGFKATGTGDHGAVKLAGARIGGQLALTGAKLRNDSGPALNAHTLDVGQQVFLTGGFIATASAHQAAVSLDGARIGGQLECTDAELTNEAGPALSGDSMQVGQSMFLTASFSGGGRAVVDMTNTRVGGTFLFCPARLEHEDDPQRRIAVDGLTYLAVPAAISARDWLRLLRAGTVGYAAQPYQQLAAGCRALGDDRQAREVVTTQRNDQLARTQPRSLERLWGRVTKVTLGYGYQPWRALLFLAGVVVLSCALTVVLGSHGALAATGTAATAGRSCTVLQDVSVGLDLNLPVGTSLARAGCGLASVSASVTAAWLAAVGWVLRLLAWAFAALFIAGFTSAVRRT